MRQAHRFSGPGKPYQGTTKLTNGGPVWTGDVRMVHKLLDEPLHWRTPRRVFVNSMSDLFHGLVDTVFIGSVLGIASACPQHTFQVLTKRPKRMIRVTQSDAFLDAYEASQSMYTHTETPWPAPNIWLGVSVEDQASAEERIPLLLQTPARVRWISAEPLLGDIVVPDLHALDWVVAGGESGPGARPMHPAWVRRLRDECAVAHVPFFFKQWGAWAPVKKIEDAPGRPQMVVGGDCMLTRDGRSEILKWPLRSTLEAEATPLRRFGKKRAGRLLDGRTHDEYPQ